MLPVVALHENILPNGLLRLKINFIDTNFHSKKCLMLESALTSITQ